MYFIKNILSIVFIIVAFCGYCQVKEQIDLGYLFLIEDTITNERTGYINNEGDTVIPPGKYRFCFTDTIKKFGIVYKNNVGFIGIDKNETILFEIFPFDNGPDIVSEGMFRIIDQCKIGYANSSGQIIIKPQFDCAFPFHNGVAKVSLNCEKTTEGEHQIWKSNNWFYIKKTGEQIDIKINSDDSDQNE